MSRSREFDAIVVGAGPNGLVAANTLADHGWSVLVLEAQNTAGGAVRSDRAVHADFVHDTFSAFYPLGVASPPIRRLDLERHGLEWVRAPAVVGTPMDDGRWAVIEDDIDATAAGLDRLTPGDGERWRRVCALWDRVGTSLIDCVTSPFPPVLGGARLLRHLPRVGGMEFVRLLLEPATVMSENLFDGEAARLLLLGNAAHSDIPLNAPGSGLMGLVMTMLGQFHGFPVPRGGAQGLTAALAARLESRSGELRTGQHVDKIVLDGRHAIGVETAGRRILARKAVIVTAAAPRLYGEMIEPELLPTRVRRGMRGFRLDPGTVKVDWALSAPVPWRGAPNRAPGTVHLADSVDQLVESLQQLAAHRVPAEPFLLIGQMTTTDATRSPTGTESLWAYTHVPQTVTGDAGGDAIGGAWNQSDCERMADRMEARIERRAPGFRGSILTRRVLGPRELEARDENLIGGAVNGGTGSLHQQLVFRPIPGLGRGNTPFRGLYLGSASAHPGGGVHGAAGANAARAALAGQRIHVRRRS